MKNLFHIFLFAFGMFLSFPSHSADLKICEKGISKCEPLIKTPAKYSKCMKLICYEFYADTDKKNKDESEYYFEYVGMQEGGTSKKPTNNVSSELARSCEYGIRKCDALASNEEYYWECMTDSCRSPDQNAKADCDDGRTQCQDLQKIYNDCMSLTCGSPAATFDTCPEARNSCKESFRSYWQCVYKICLGPVEKYMRPATTQKFMIVKDRNGIKRRIQVNKVTPTLSNVPGWAARAPAGVDPEEWIRSTPQKFMIIGNPSDHMRCMIPTALIDCPQSDIRSCRCNDGSIPIMLQGTPSPSYDDSK